MSDSRKSGGGANISFTFHAFDEQSFSTFLEGNRESLHLELKRLIEAGTNRHRKICDREVQELAHIGEDGICERCRSSGAMHESADGALYFGPIA